MVSLLADPAIRNSVVPISAEQYRRMGEAGIIDTQTELIDGVILRKMIKSPLHTLTVKTLVDAIQPQLPESCELRKEEPLSLTNSEPEPDIAIVIKDSYDPGRCHPISALLVIEVAISSEAIDRAKAAIYAGAGVAEYWLVLAEKRIVEQFTGPAGDRYERCKSLDFQSLIASEQPLNLRVDLRTLT